MSPVSVAAIEPNHLEGGFNEISSVCSANMMSLEKLSRSTLRKQGMEAVSK